MGAASDLGFTFPQDSLNRLFTAVSRQGAEKSFLWEVYLGRFIKGSGFERDESGPGFAGSILGSLGARDGDR